MDEPAAGDINETGVIASVVQSLKLPNGHIKVMVEGVVRGRIRAFTAGAGHLSVSVERLEPKPLGTSAAELVPYLSKVLSVFEQYAKLSHNLAFEGLLSSLKMDDPEAFADMLAGHLPTSIATTEKQALLETVNPLERLQKLQDLLEIEIEKINIDRRINNKVKKQMERAQKEYYLNEKIKAIHQELGRKDDKSDELEELKVKIEKAGMPKETKEKALAEMKRLEAMPNVSAEATVSRNYIDWLVNVPWKKATREMRDIKRAEKILNEDHFGLEKVKERILEFLAVRQLVTETKGSILCFAGPPGVGKTSLAKSIAKSLNRKFVRLSLGGVRDEAEVRGHRRTYIGAFPGQIIQLMKKAGTVNPVFLLDEVDKMSMDFRGDPSAALLEVLDPEQNHAFVDHYLDTEYDLSKVMFIATANVVHPIPPALKDRMEIIPLSGYTPNEKVAIAKQFLVPKQIKENGLTTAQAVFEDGALYGLIEKYTREAGVRNLEREIASVCRKIARKIIGKDAETPLTRHGREPRVVPRQAEVPPEQEGRHGRDRPRDRPRLDGIGRRRPPHRDDADARQGQPRADRPARRRHAGERAGRAVVREDARGAVRRGRRLLREEGHPRPHPRGRDPEGRALGGHHDGDVHPLGRHEDPDPQGPRDDGGDHAPRQGPARGRHQGEAPRGLPRRHHDDPPAEGEREGPRRPAGGDPDGHGVPPRRGRGRGRPPHARGRAVAHGPEGHRARGGNRAADGTLTLPVGVLVFPVFSIR